MLWRNYLSHYLMNLFLWMLVQWTSKLCPCHISNNIFWVHIHFKFSVDSYMLERTSGYFRSKVQATKAWPMKTIWFLLHMQCLQAYSGWKCIDAPPRPVSGCRDDWLARQALNHSTTFYYCSFQAFCFHCSKLLLTWCYVSLLHMVLKCVFYISEECITSLV